MEADYGSVFRRGGSGGPVFSSLKSPGSLPTWPDWRKAGNTNANEPAHEIMKRWDNKKMKQFEIFMDRFYQSKTPWRQDWLDRTAPSWKANEGKILKCKMELIRRIIKIKLMGPESLEDWILLFLYMSNELNIPQGVEDLLRPSTAFVSADEFIRQEQVSRTVDNIFVLPPDKAIEYPTNMPMWGFERMYGALDQQNRPRIDYVLNQQRRERIRPETQAILTDRGLVFPRGTSVIPIPLRRGEAAGESLRSKMSLRRQAYTDPPP